jgi:hypothetical protein
MNSNATHEVVPIAVNVVEHVSVRANSVRVSDLTIEQPGIVAYLRRIAPNKQEIALVHALEVGIIAMQARRERVN